MESSNNKRLYTASQTAEYLGLKEQTVRQWASMGKLPKVKLGGKALRFDKDDLDRLIASDKSPARYPEK